jgi:hypothetical protein
MVGSEVGSSKATPAWAPSLLACLAPHHSHLSPRKKAIAVRYIADMGAILQEIARVLKPRGRAILVLGDCRVDGVPIRIGRLASSMAGQHHLRLVASSTRQILASRRYLPPPERCAHPIATRIRHETILEFRKGGA